LALFFVCQSLHVDLNFMLSRGGLYLSAFYTAKGAFYRISRNPDSWRGLYWSPVKHLVLLWRQKETSDGHLVDDTTVLAKLGKESRHGMLSHRLPFIRRRLRLGLSL
jgi:hypothetical protein